MIDTNIFECPISKLDCGKFTLYDYVIYDYILNNTKLSTDVIRLISEYTAYSPRPIDKWKKNILINDLSDLFKWSGARYHHVPARTLFLSLCLSGKSNNAIYLTSLLNF